MRKKIKQGLGRIASKLKSYTIENWGFPFISAFLVLLIASALLMVANQTWIAELSANYAYLLLAVGVMVQIVCFSINGKLPKLRHRFHIRKH